MGRGKVKQRPHCFPHRYGGRLLLFEKLAEHYEKLSIPSSPRKERNQRYDRLFTKRRV